MSTIQSVIIATVIREFVLKVWQLAQSVEVPATASLRVFVHAWKSEVQLPGVCTSRLELPSF